MPNDAKPTVGTPSKGKFKEDTTWNCGWWDFYPLSEYPRRPIEWSNSSVIFTAHALNPQILARHFSSSKQFVIPSPTPINQNPNKYEPPTVITASKDNQWLFAFFPGKGQDGICCLWQRGFELDRWSVKEFWQFAPGAGVVTADWLAPPREWAIDPDSGVPTRLPARGPSAPVSKPTLIFVTENHQFYMCYFRQYLPTLKMLRVSLLQNSVATERQPDNSTNSLNDASSTRICINAAIGAAYGDSSILIAMRSQVFPLPSSLPPDEFSLDLGLSLDIEPDQTDTYPTSREDWVEDPVIEFVEVQPRFDGLLVVLSSKIYPPIEDASSRLGELCFVHQPPLKEAKPTIYLVASFLDFKDYVSLPACRVKCYPFTKVDEKGSWTAQSEFAREFDSGILAHITPSPPFYGACGVYVSIFNTSGTQPRQKLKQAEIAIGNTKALKIPDLTDDENWEASPILSPVHRIGREVPIAISVSPGQNLSCMVFPSPWSTQISVQKLPRRSTESAIPFVALAFVIATLSNYSTVDLTHVLSQPSMPQDEVAEILYQTFTLLDRHMPGSFTSQLGLTIESYRSRASRISSSADKERADAIWHTAHDMASVATCNAVFGDCIDGEEYHTDLTWQMIDLSSWIMGLLEKLVKECILSSDFTDAESSSNDLFTPSSPNKSSRPLVSPVFLHLVHPVALQNLRTALAHVKQYETYLASLAPRTENAQLSREVLLDLVECSGIDLQGLKSIFDKLAESVQAFDDDEVRRALASFQPSLSMQISLREAVNTMARSPALNKARLFVKSYEMVDGEPNVPLDRPTNTKDKSRDVVSKGLLLHRPAQGSMTCLRCGGQTEYGKDTKVSRQMMLWEKSWARKCICG
ncbi:hypothetical protein GYMLUDRAFT_228779, partial [Collybiopsis luxurians FD-317 M1]